MTEVETMANIYNIRNIQTYQGLVVRKNKKIAKIRTQIEVLSEKIVELERAKAKAINALRDAEIIRVSQGVVNNATEFDADKIGTVEGEQFEKTVYRVNGVWCKLVCITDGNGNPTKDENGHYLQEMKPLEA